MVAFYKHGIADWRDGTAELSDRAYRVYHVIIEQIMLNEGPIQLHERSLAGLSNRSVRDFQAALRELVETGKVIISDGKIDNIRTRSELSRVNSNRENAASGGRVVPERSATTSRVVSERSANGEREVGEAQEIHNEINGHPQAVLNLETSLRDKTRLDETRPSEERKASPKEGSVAPRKIGSRLPADWVLPDDWRAYATAKGFQAGPIGLMAEKFKNYWIGKPGKEAVKLDWAATWRNWVISEFERHPPKPEEKEKPVYRSCA